MNEVWIKTVGPLGGDGTQDDPFNGSDVDRLDEFLRVLPENTVIHFLPGKYRTRGYHAGESDPSKIWQPKRGQKLIGAGVDVTVLRLVDASIPTTGYSVIGCEYNQNADDLEITGMTLDADLDNQVGAKLANCIGVFGSRIHIHHIKGRRFGSLNNTLECFAISANGGHINVGPKAGNVIEDCIAIEPSPNMSQAGTTAFMIGGGDEPAIFHDAPTLRRNFVDAGKVANVRGYTMAGVRSGFIADNTALNCHHGVYGDSSRNHGITIRGNRFLRVICGVGYDYAGRVEVKPIETRLDIIANEVTLRDGTGASGVSLSGTDAEGPDTFKRVGIHRNSFSLVSSPGDIAGISIRRAGHVEITENAIALPATARRIHLRNVKAWRVVDTFYEGKS